MAASAAAVTKASILMTGATFWIVEDVGGTTVMNNGRNPNSFVYRFVPLNPDDLTHGKLQALQVSINGNPLVFVPVDAGHPNGDTRSQNQLLLHTMGASWPVQWVTVHDTEVNGTASFRCQRSGKSCWRNTIQAAGEWAVPARFTFSDLLLCHHWRYG